MKKFIPLILALLPLCALGQLKPIAESANFTEPDDGYPKILLLKNGNTVYLRFTIKEGIDVRIYDGSHKEIVSKNLKPEYGKLKVIGVKGVYEMDQNIVAFVSEYDEGEPVLYRITIDGQTGNLKELKTIATLKKEVFGQGYAIKYGDVPAPDFMVRKDPASGNCGVIRYNTFEHNAAERIELIQYAGNGTEQSRHFLSSPDNKYKYTQIIDFAVVGDDAFALIYGYNTGKSGGVENDLMLAAIKDGSVHYFGLGKASNSRISDGVLRYNSVTGNLIFLTSEFTSSEGGGLFGNKIVDQYSVQFSVIDVANPSIKKKIDFAGSSVFEKYRQIFKKDKGGFGPFPQQLYINDDGSFTVLMEEITEILTTRSNNTYTSGYLLGSAAVITYSEDGTERSNIIIPKRQGIGTGTMADGYNGQSSNYYIARLDNGAPRMIGGSQFKTLAYLNGRRKSYIFINDIEKNAESITKGKLTTIFGVGDCEGWIYELPQQTNIPSRTMAFPKVKEKEHNLGVFGVSAFDREKAIYATMKVLDRKASIVWFGE